MSTIYYKVLNAEGRSFHGGELGWSLPARANDGEWTPGEWHEVKGAVRLCSNGLHLTSEPPRWWADGARCFLVEYDGTPVGDGGDKVAVRRARLVRELVGPELAAVRIFTEGRHEVTGGHAIAAGAARVVARGNSSVVAWGNSSVEAWENSSVVARENSSVVARENSSVVAWGNSSVVAWENSSVEARENSSVEAWENSSVEARENSSVVARENSSVVARENSSVVARENSSVVARENSSVVARENSSVVARENSSVVAWGNSSVEAWGNSSVEARGNSGVTTPYSPYAWGQPTVQVAGYAVWTDRRSGKPVVHAVVGAAQLVEEAAPAAGAES